MPTLDWIGKNAVVNHHRKVPYHLLRSDPALSVGDPDSGNLLVQGDNLLALNPDISQSFDGRAVTSRPEMGYEPIRLFVQLQAVLGEKFWPAARPQVKKDRNRI